MTAYHDGVLVDGLLKGFGDALAAELHLTPRYVAFPRKRVEDALAHGTADLLCDLRPEWLERQDWLWSDAIFTNSLMIGSRRGVAPPADLAALRGKRLGTVLGYRYGELEQALGTAFVRDEAVSDDINLSKLVRHRFDFMVTNSLYFDYQRKVHPDGRALNPERYTIMSFDTYCALPAASRIGRARVNQAIAALRRNGTMQSILDRFRVLP